MSRQGGKGAKVTRPRCLLGKRCPSALIGSFRNLKKGSNWSKHIRRFTNWGVFWVKDLLKCLDPWRNDSRIFCLGTRTSLALPPNMALLDTLFLTYLPTRLRLPEARKRPKTPSEDREPKRTIEQKTHKPQANPRTTPLKNP